MAEEDAYDTLDEPVRETLVCRSPFLVLLSARLGWLFIFPSARFSPSSARACCARLTRPYDSAKT